MPHCETHLGPGSQPLGSREGVGIPRDRHWVFGALANTRWKARNPGRERGLGCGVLGGRTQGIPVPSLPPFVSVVTPKKAASSTSRSSFFLCHHPMCPVLKPLPGSLPGLVPLNPNPSLHWLICKYLFYSWCWGLQKDKRPALRSPHPSEGDIIMQQKTDTQTRLLQRRTGAAKKTGPFDADRASLVDGLRVGCSGSHL